MIDETVPSQLFLIRHGESTANERGVLQGKTIDEPLSERGLRQAQAVAECLRRFPVHRIFTSGLHRARQTAEAIAAGRDVEVVSLEALHEIDVGDWHGKSWDTIRQETPEAAERYLADPVEYGHPGGESYHDVLVRVQPVFETLFREHASQTLVVVSHNVVNRVYLAHLLGIDLRRSTVIRQHNGCINHIRHARGQTTVVGWNSVLHLDVER